MTILPSDQQSKKASPTRSEIDLASLIVGVLTFEEIIPLNLEDKNHIANHTYAIRLIAGLLANTRYEEGDMPQLPFDI